VLGTELGTGEMAVKETPKSPSLGGVDIPEGAD
jgi:hypothetical protein